MRNVILRRLKYEKNLFTKLKEYVLKCLIRFCIIDELIDMDRSKIFRMLNFYESRIFTAFANSKSFPRIFDYEDNFRIVPFAKYSCVSESVSTFNGIDSKISHMKLQMLKRVIYSIRCFKIEKKNRFNVDRIVVFKEKISMRSISFSCLPTH